MPFRINCELCGNWIQAERRSRQYCARCRPKAVVLNSVCKMLNQGAQADPVTIDALVEQRVVMENRALAGAYPFLDGATAIGVMAVLNMALNEYGPICWDGTKFEIVRWIDRAGVSEEPVAMAGNFSRSSELVGRGRQNSSYEGTTAEHVQSDVGADVVGTERPRRPRGEGVRGLSESDHGIIFGPGSLPRRRGPMIYSPNADNTGFEHVGFANPGGDEIFGTR